MNVTLTLPVTWIELAVAVRERVAESQYCYAVSMARDDKQEGSRPWLSPAWSEVHQAKTTLVTGFLAGASPTNGSASPRIHP